MVAGRRSQQAHGFTAHIWYQNPTDSQSWQAESEFAEGRPQADAGTALRIALRRLTPLMASRRVQTDIAAPFGLLVQMRASALADLLEEMLSAAILAAPASRLLLTAAGNGGRVAICVTDDMPNADAALRRATVRGLMDRVASRGATLDIDVRPAEGTTMTLHLDGVAESRHRQSAGLGTLA
jgi:nitrate/nitrite-specific signal transduction histidine kinase